jgi:hypothetical protein
MPFPKALFEKFTKKNKILRVPIKKNVFVAFGFIFFCDMNLLNDQ